MKIRPKRPEKRRRAFRAGTHGKRIGRITQQPFEPRPRRRCISRIWEKAGESRMLLLWSAAALVRRSKAKTDAAAFFVGSLLPTIRAQWRYGASIRLRRASAGHELAPTKAEPRFRTPQKGRSCVQPSHDLGKCTPVAARLCCSPSIPPRVILMERIHYERISANSTNRQV